MISIKTTNIYKTYCFADLFGGENPYLYRVRVSRATGSNVRRALKRTALCLSYPKRNVGKQTYGYLSSGQTPNRYLFY